MARSVMRGTLVRALTAALALSVLANWACAEPIPQGDVLTGHAPDRLIVRLATGVIDSSDTHPLRALGPGGRMPVPPDQVWDTAPPAQFSRGLQDAWYQWGAKRMQRAYPQAIGNPQLAADLGVDRYYIIEVPTGTDVPAMAAALSEFDDQIESVELDVYGTIAEGYIPNDSLFWRQWGMHNEGQTIDNVRGTVDADIDAPEAWKIHTGNWGTVTVAILDTGVNPHIEFADRMVPGTNTGNPLTPDLTTDSCYLYHGTHVAGIVAAAGDNSIGVAGVSWGANIMPVRVFEGCTGLASAAAHGILWATDHGADIINVSLQFCSGFTSLLGTMTTYANQSGVLVVAASGNNSNCGAGVVASPARYSSAIAVGGTTSRDLIATTSSTNWTSDYGPQLEVCAPGDRIRSTSVSNGYRDLSGTSMATPHVSGLAALLKSFDPTLTHTEIRNVIRDTADDLGPAGWDDRYGYGRINAHNALQALIPQIVGSDPLDGAIDARQPSEPDGSNPAGWQWVDLSFSRGAAAQEMEDFTIDQDGAEGPPPTIVGIVHDEDIVRVILGRKISPGAWTTITHVESGTSVRLGFLPADVNGDGTSSPADILSVIDALNGVTVLPIWSTDVDRSGEAQPADILRVIDLLNGAGSYEPYLNVSLP